MKLEIEILSETDAAEIVNSFCIKGNYKDQIPNPAYDPKDEESTEDKFIPNISKEDFACQEIIKMLKKHTIGVIHRTEEEKMQAIVKTKREQIEAININVSIIQ